MKHLLRDADRPLKSGSGISASRRRTTTDRSSFERLSAAEALRALYIDFEGEKDKTPVLLGVLRRGQGARPYVHSHILDRDFAAFARVTSLHDAVLNVVMRAEKGDRRIVAWTEHELKVVRTLANEDPNLVARFEARFANAKRLAERWRNRVHAGEKPDDGRLSSYLAFVGYEVPPEGAPGDVGETIRTLRNRLARGQALTALQAERWRRLVEHNRHDCVGMRRLTLMATKALESGT
jgi:hypothetical protein